MPAQTRHRARPVRLFAPLPADARSRLRTMSDPRWSSAWFLPVRRPRGPALYRLYASNRGGSVSTPPVLPSDEDAKLIVDIEASRSEAPHYDVLRTDERVLARVTDGIYRQPGSAIRELMSNAYDADAKRVVIRTRPPPGSVRSLSRTTVSE